MSSLIKDLQKITLEAEIAIQNLDSSNANGLKNALENKKQELEKDDAKEYSLRPEDPFSPKIPKQDLLKQVDDDINRIALLVRPFPKKR